MRIFAHPAFPHITTSCTHDAQDCDHAEKGWVPVEPAPRVAPGKPRRPASSTTP